jgi:phospholipid-transporting ATPase
MNSVIFYRASPKQKARIVELIKKNINNSTTLSIGDGANDVHMITAAHIGIGIIGNEGKQAARASDYSIGQFHFLKRLLLVHGRESYRKNTYIVCYNFYKNSIFVIPQFWFGIYSLFSGQTLYDPWIYQFYNIIFTSLPIIWFGIYDQEEDLDSLSKKETFYFQGMIDKLFHTTRFWKWVIQGAFQGFVVFIVFYFSFSSCEESGLNQDLWSIGSMVFSAVVLIVNIRMLFSTNSHNIISVFLFAISIFIYYLVLFLMSQYRFENYNNFDMIMFTPRLYLASLISVAIILIFDYGIGNLMMSFGCIKNTNKMEKLTLEKYYSHIFMNNSSTTIANSNLNGIN